MRFAFFGLCSLVVVGACVGDDPEDLPGDTPGEDASASSSSSSSGASGTPDGGEVPGCSAVSVTLAQPASLHLDGRIDLSVQIAREGGDAEVGLRVTTAPAGVSAAPVVVPAGANQASLQLVASAEASTGRSDLVVEATCGGVRGQATTRLLVRGAPGTLDTSYGVEGSASAPTSGQVGTGVLRAVAMREGRLYVAALSGNEARIVAFTADGALDNERFGGSFSTRWEGPAGFGSLITLGGMNVGADGVTADLLYSNGASSPGTRHGYVRYGAKLGADPAPSFSPAVIAGYEPAGLQLGVIGEGDKFFTVSFSGVANAGAYQVVRRSAQTGAIDTGWSSAAKSYGRGNAENSWLGIESLKSFSSNEGFLFFAVPVTKTSAPADSGLRIWVDRRGSAVGASSHFLPSARIAETGSLQLTLSPPGADGTVYVSSYPGNAQTSQQDLCIHKLIDLATAPAPVVCLSLEVPATCNAEVEDCGSAGTVSPLSGGNMAFSLTRKGQVASLQVRDAAGAPLPGWEQGAALAGAAFRVLEDDAEGLIVVHAKSAPWMIQRFWK